MLGSWNIKKLLAIIVLVLLCSGVVNAEKYEGKNLKEEKELSCKYNPKCKNFPKVKKIDGIKYPLTMVQKQRREKPSGDNYYIFHFKPKTKKPAPYVVIIPTSGGMTQAAAVTFERYANKLVERGFGVVILDLFYNTGIDRGTISRGPAASMGALSIIEFIKSKYPKLTNNKFGIVGGSRGGLTVLSLAGELIRENYLFKNVNHWFDAGVAFYPSCGKQKLLMPVIVFIGELDEWVSSVNCKMWKQRDPEQLASGILQIFIYENAHHGFNREMIKNLSRASEKDHDFAGRASQYNENADKDSDMKMLNFFENKLKSN